MRGTLGEVIEELRRSTVQVMTNRSGNGSGVIWSEDGLIVTNAHVVERAGKPGRAQERTVEVELWDGRRMPGRIVKRDRRRDVAAIRVEASGLPAATAVDSNKLRVGELVVAVGNPFGFTGAASTGVVHRLSWSDDRQGTFDNRSWVVSQLRLAPGNSGGPLANALGEVVGINTMVAGGLAFSIPSGAVSEFLSAPRKQQVGLGLVVQPVPLGHAGSRLGLIVLEVVPGSPADLGSLLQGDTLVGAAGKSFHSVQDLQIAMQASEEGILDVQFRRGVSENIRTVAIRMAPASVKAA
jgi:serine protease Do